MNGCGKSRKTTDKLLNSTANIAGGIKEKSARIIQIKGLELLELESGKKGGYAQGRIL